MEAESKDRTKPIQRFMEMLEKNEKLHCVATLTRKKKLM